MLKSPDFSDWRSYGRFTFSGEKGYPICPPNIPSSAGVYRIVHDDGAEYYGHGYNLFRRIQEHANNSTSDRDRKLRKILMNAGGGELFACTQLAVNKVYEHIREQRRHFPAAERERRAFVRQCKEAASKQGVELLDSAGSLADGITIAANHLASDTVKHFEQEAKRMAETAAHTAAYANGQTILVTVKSKDLGFERTELQEEVAHLLQSQDFQCALTRYRFQVAEANPHLKPSLDRIDSARGYVRGNLQVVTRAANFFKSASDVADWSLKVAALRAMAKAMDEA